MKAKNILLLTITFSLSASENYWKEDTPHDRILKNSIFTGCTTTLATFTILLTNYTHISSDNNLVSYPLIAGTITGSAYYCLSRFLKKEKFNYLLKNLTQNQ